MEHQQFNNWIKKTSLPRAIADFSNQRFIAWNTTLSRTGWVLRRPAALFAVESAKNALEAQNLPAVKELEKASELLSEAVEKTADALEGKKL